jgi:squalene-associated FAD-dependent desaturase
VRVAVVGGGFAGLAAAVALQERRHEVTLFERRGILGGRATSFRDSTFHEEVDNGTHLMVGAYRETLDLLARAGASDLLAFQPELTLDYQDEEGRSSLACPPLPAPLHLLFGLLSLRLPWKVRLDAARFALAVKFGGDPPGTLAEFFERTGQGGETRRLLWDPLATAIVNDTPERAAAVLFVRVFREAFLTTRGASRLVFNAAGWGTLVERVGAYFENRGGRLLRRTRVLSVRMEGGAAAGVDLLRKPEDRESVAAGVPGRRESVDADAIVLAVPWSAVPELVPEEVRAPFQALPALGSSPIVSVEVWVDRIVVDRAMVGLRREEMEWVFDKGRLFGRSGAPQHLSFIVSAAHRANPRPNASLVASTEAALRRYFPGMAEARVLKSLVFREPTATFLPTPEHEALRPGAVTHVPGLFLAGDWTRTGLPATIEGAVRSGRVAAGAAEAWLRTRLASGPPGAASGSR